MGEKKLFVFGLGYTAVRLATAVKAEGWSVAGTTRTPERAEILAAAGFDVHLFAPGHPLDDPAKAFDGVTHALFTIPPDSRGDPVLAAYGEALAKVPTIEWAGYLSSTAVYGDTGGEWVGEASWLKPGSDRARHRVVAEKGWLDLRRQAFFPVHVFRLPGIYGPGRSAIDDLRAGRAKRIDKPGQVFSRIHADDIVQTLRASMAKPNPGGIYNVADDRPAPAHEVVAFAAQLLGMEPPPLIPFDQAELSPMAASFYAECRRVKNDRIKNRLGVTLLYPDYQAGLAAQRAAEA